MPKKGGQENFANDISDLGETQITQSDDSYLPNDQSPVANTRVFRRRWLMLLIFVLVFMTNAFQWIQFSIINNLITK